MTIASAIVFLAVFVVCLCVQHRTDKRSDAAHKEVKKVSREIVTRLRESRESPSVVDNFSPASGSWPPGAG